MSCAAVFWTNCKHQIWPMIVNSGIEGIFIVQLRCDKGMDSFKAARGEKAIDFCNRSKVEKTVPHSCTKLLSKLEITIKCYPNISCSLLDVGGEGA